MPVGKVTSYFIFTLWLNEASLPIKSNFRFVSLNMAVFYSKNIALIEKCVTM